MNNKNNNKSFKLIISFIIIVVLILLFLLIWKLYSSSSDTSNSSLEDFSQSVEEVNNLMLNRFTELFKSHGQKSEERSNSQLYCEAATGIDTGESGDMKGSIISNDSGETKSYQRINPDIYDLPKVRNSNLEWYVINNGQIFNATGYYDEESNRTYFTPYCYQDGKLEVDNKKINEEIAQKISNTLQSGDLIVK